MVRSEGGKLRKVVVSAPGDAYFEVADLPTHNIDEIADRDATLVQFEALVATMANAGVDVVDVPELRGHPNSVFPRDVSLCVPDGYVRLRMGLEPRRGEEAWIAAVLEEIGQPCVGVIESPGTVEGGDVILAGDVAFVGLSRRSNEHGVGQLSSMLATMSYEVRTARVPDHFLHLGGAMSLIAPDRILASAGVFAGGFFEGFEVIAVAGTGASAANVICLDANEVVADATGAPSTALALEDSGVTVHALDLSEFAKGRGGPTCLILPVDRGV